MGLLLGYKRILSGNAQRKLRSPNSVMQKIWQGRKSITITSQHHRITTSPNHHIPKSPHHHITVKLFRLGDAGEDGITSPAVFRTKCFPAAMWGTWFVRRVRPAIACAPVCIGMAASGVQIATRIDGDLQGSDGRSVELLRQGDAGGDGIARSPVFSHKVCKMLPNDRTMWGTFSVSKLLCVKARCV